MKKFVFISTTFLLLFLSNIKAQEVAPLQLGNIWIYNTGTTLVKVTVVDTNTVIDTIVYNKFKNISNYGFISDGHSRLREDGYYAMRRDTSYPAPNHELLYYKKDTVIGDTWENPAPYFPLIYTVLDTFVTTVFGSSQTVKHLEIDGSLVLFNEYWTEKFGKLSRSDFGGLLESLQGCVINGIAYGDTSFTIVGVEDEFNTPHDFILEQNYPNPFNPTTNIQYAIGSPQFVTLKVYDVLGNEVATLVNEERLAGKYEVKFNAAHNNVLSSGVYFYQLKAGSYIGIKKMIVTK